MQTQSSLVFMKFWRIRRANWQFNLQNSADATTEDVMNESLEPRYANIPATTYPSFLYPGVAKTRRLSRSTVHASTTGSKSLETAARRSSTSCAI